MTAPAQPGSSTSPAFRRAGGFLPAYDEVVGTSEISGNFVSLLLLVCVFAPYGMIPGDLRLDHLSVYAALLFVLVRRAGRVPPLAKALFAVVGFAIVGTALHLEIFLGNMTQAFKYLDGLLRGPIVFVVAASIAPRPKELRRVLLTITAIAVILAIMGLGERILPHNSPFCQVLVERYGGVVYDEGAYKSLGANHKYLMLLADRASAVFVTAPSLAFAGVFFIAVGIAPLPELSPKLRAVLIVCGTISGLAANSKSFVLGVPLLFALSLTDPKLRQKVVGWPLVIIAGLLVLAMLAASAYGLAWDPLEKALGSNDDTLSAMSAGRYTESGSILEVSGYTLRDSPLFGYGIANNRAAGVYSDSGVNRFVVHSGIVGTIIAFTGIVGQVLWFWRRRVLSPWGGLGACVLIVAISFFFAGAIFQMPRINDILFVILGLAYANLASSTGTGPTPTVPAAERDGSHAAPS